MEVDVPEIPPSLEDWKLLYAGRGCIGGKASNHVRIFGGANSVRCSISVILAVLALSANGSSGADKFPVEPKARMPLPTEDVLWVSSIPSGAKVFVFAKKKGQVFPPENTDGKPSVASTWTDQPTKGDQQGPWVRESLGVTPLAIHVPAGIYCVAVLLDVAIEKVPCGLTASSGYLNLGRYNIGFGEGDISMTFSSYLNDGNQELWQFCVDGVAQRIGKTYEVEKTEGQAATVIALFQHVDQDLSKLYKPFPNASGATNYMATPDSLILDGLPADQAPVVSDRLQRGGKVLQLDADGSYLMVELTPAGARISQSDKYVRRMIEKKPATEKALKP